MVTGGSCFLGSIYSTETIHQKTLNERVATPLDMCLEAVMSCYNQEIKECPELIYENCDILFETGTNTYTAMSLYRETGTCELSSYGEQTGLEHTVVSDTTSLVPYSPKCFI